MNKPSIDWQISSLRIINRGMFGLALLGVLDTIHLYVQDQFGFNKGCLGFIDASIEQSFNCQQVVSSEAGALLGISNTILGISFFILLTVFMFIRIYRLSRYQSIINNAISTVLGFAFLYMLYLVYYQYAVLQKFCLLCLVSAAITTLLFALEIIRRFFAGQRFADTKTDTSKLARETRVRLLVAVLVLLLSAADLYIADIQSAPNIAGKKVKTTTYQADSLLLEHSNLSSVPMSTPATDCQYSDSIASNTALQSLISFYDPVVGSSNPQVTVVFYFDPLHNATYRIANHLKKLGETWSDKIEIAYKPVAVNDSSLLIIRAIYTSVEKNRFNEFFHSIHLKQENKTSVQRIIRRAAGKAGLDQDSLFNTAISSQYNSRIYLEKEKANAANIQHLPAILINGKRVALNSLSESCLSQLVKNFFNVSISDYTNTYTIVQMRI